MSTITLDYNFKMELIRSVVEYSPDKAKTAVEKALSRGIDPQHILDDGLVVGIEQVGMDFGSGRLFLPELVGASMAMQAGLNVLKSHWQNMENERKILGRVILGTVKGDIHNIGKDIVGSLLSAAGFDVNDLGIDVSEKNFLEKVKLTKPDILGLSALLTTTMPQQSYVIESLKAAGIREKVKVIVGGAPTTEEWASRIGADGWAPNAALAVATCKNLLGL